MDRTLRIELNGQQITADSEKNPTGAPFTDMV